MFCSKCGAQLEDGSVFCSSCGSQVGYGQPAPTVNNAYANPVNNGVNNGYANPYGNPVFVAQPVLGLGWAHFLGYGFLWVGAFFNFCLSIAYIMGSIEIQDVPMEYYYMYYGDSLMFADKFYGILGFGMVALEIVAAIYIISYKKNAGNLVFALYLSRLIAALLILIIKIAVTGDAEMGIFQYICIPYSLVMTIVNKIYFDNRRAAFVK